MGIVVRFSRERHVRASSATGSLKRNTEGSTSFPKAARASRNSTKYSAGNSSRLLHMLTADVPTPASDAVAPVPPSASITSSTELSMSLHSSHNVKLSSIHVLGVECGPIVMPKSVMAESNKSLARRLKMTREALDLDPVDVRKRLKVTASAWSMYESGERRITVRVAIRFCEEYGLTLDWIYRADPARLPNDIRLKIQQAA